MKRLEIIQNTPEPGNDYFIVYEGGSPAELREIHDTTDALGGSSYGIFNNEGVGFYTDWPGSSTTLTSDILVNSLEQLGYTVVHVDKF